MNDIFSVFRTKEREVKTTVLFRFLVGGLLFCAAQALAQFTPKELAEREQWEDFLRTADIVGTEQIQGDVAVTSPWKLTLKNGTETKYGLWKNPEGEMGGYLEGWRYEIAAYRLDKCLGFNMVPPTIERRFHGDRGSLQLWIDNCITLKQKIKKKIQMPSYRIFNWNRSTFLQRAWDNLIANEDRNINQILITQDWSMILIDHSRTFRTTKKFTTALIYSQNGKEGTKLMSELPRPFVEKLRGLTFDGIKSVVGEYLTDKEIAAVLLRRDLILKEIDRLIKINGEDKVLY